MLAALLNHLWQSTLFAVAIALLVPFVRNNGAHVRYWLWWAASVKFLVPFAWLTALGAALYGPSVPIFELPVFTVAVGRIIEPVASPLPSGLTLALLGAWAVGVVGVLAYWLKRTLTIRAAVACAEACADAWTANAGLAVKEADTLLEPGIVGIFRPVLLVPRGISARLTLEQLRAIVAHERCHWRRRDNLTAALHMVVEAVFWFHPLVWWIGARLIEERERACDEAVVKAGHDPRTYADGVLNVCELYVATRLACAAGVSGADLKRRVTYIMRSRVMHKLNAMKKVLLSTATLGTLAVPIAIGMLRGAPAMAQDDRDVIPLVRIAPDYPPEAVQQRLEGHVILEFTITAEGTTKDITVAESSSPIFDEAAIKAVSRWRYSPRLVDGAGVERPGTRTVIRFALAPEGQPPGPANPPTPGSPLVTTPDDADDDEP
jgi:TonB family protein